MEAEKEEEDYISDTLVSLYYKKNGGIVKCNGRRINSGSTRQSIESFLRMTSLID